MNPKHRETFLAWHTTKKERNYVFNFQEEIVTYCRSDVDILRRCCLEFRELFHNVTDIDPFTILTIASACHLVYRTNYLLKDTIAIIPPLGYCPKNKQSLFAHKWLSYTAEKNETYVQHARNGGEKRVGPYLLDGYHEETHTVRYREPGQWQNHAGTPLFYRGKDRALETSRLQRRGNMGMRRQPGIE